MRILAVTNMYPTDEFPGSGVFVHEQIKSLKNAGVEVRVEFVDRRRYGPSAYYQMDEALAQSFYEFAPDLIHVMYGGVMAARVVQCLRSRPILVTFHGSDLLGENLSGLVRKVSSRYGVWCSIKAARGANGVIVVARRLLRALPRTVSRSKVRVIPCGIDFDRFKPMDQRLCRRELKWRDDSFHVLFASSNGDPVKRPWLATAAIAEASRRGIPAELHFMAGVSNTQVPLWLNASDALLLTSQHEGSPTVVKEALACGLPVVSVDVGDVSERIEGIQGCHLAEADAVDLAYKLDLVRQKGSRLECRGRLTDLSVQSVAGKLIDFYQHLTSANQKNGDSQFDHSLTMELT